LGQGVLRINFNQVAGRVPELTNTGSALVNIDVVNQASAGVYSVSGRTDSDLAIRTPRFADDPDGPRAVVGVWSIAGDPLSPGTAPFRFGADVQLDQGDTSGPGAGDNGDNVLQRGHYIDDAQYKLQLDHGRPSCRVKGSDGTVMVSGDPVNRGDWYTLSCARSGNTVSLTVTHYGDDGTVQSSDTTSDSGPIGTVVASSPSVPLSIGGKLSNNGDLAQDSDQFNGRLDNVVLDVG